MSAAGIESPASGTLPRLTVVIVNWNGRALLPDCLGSLSESGYPGLEVILVDNGSEDHSVAWTRKNFPEVRVIESPQNLRWAGGNNLALEQLLEEGLAGRYVLLLNNDTWVPGGSLERLVAALDADPEAWAATPRICYHHDPALIWYDGGRVGKYTGWVQHMGIRKMAGRRDNSNSRVDYGTGCALLLKPEAIKALGLLDERFHFYGEDTDYCLRIRQKNHSILHVPLALVLHKVSSALGSGSPAKSYLRARSHINLLRRHWPARGLFVLLPSQIIYFGGLAVYHLWSGRRNLAFATLEGVIDELRGARIRF